MCLFAPIYLNLVLIRRDTPSLHGFAGFALSLGYFSASANVLKALNPINGNILNKKLNLLPIHSRLVRFDSSLHMARSAETSFGFSFPSHEIMTSCRRLSLLFLRPPKKALLRQMLTPLYLGVAVSGRIEGKRDGRSLRGMGEGTRNTATYFSTTYHRQYR